MKLYKEYTTRKIEFTNRQNLLVRTKICC